MVRLAICRLYAVWVRFDRMAGTLYEHDGDSAPRRSEVTSVGRDEGSNSSNQILYISRDDALRMATEIAANNSELMRRLA